MNKEKQIEKMEKNIPARIFAYDLRANSANIDEKHRRIVAECLYRSGYRKASDVAAEIFTEIDKLAYRFMNDRHYIFGDMVYDLAELKKKYTEERE